MGSVCVGVWVCGCGWVNGLSLSVCVRLYGWSHGGMVWYVACMYACMYVCMYVYVCSMYVCVCSMHVIACMYVYVACMYVYVCSMYVCVCSMHVIACM